MSLSGQHALITGASRGIGRGIARALCQAGATVHITGRDQHSLNALTDSLNSTPGICHPYLIDHSDDAQTEKLFHDLDKHLSSSNASLSILVNNAYAAVPFLIHSSATPFWQKSTSTSHTDLEPDPAAVWDLVNGVGLRTYYVCASMAIRRMSAGGAIINLTSWAGSMHLFDVAYSVGKAAVDRLSAEIAMAAPPDVLCFAICPGVVRTEAMDDVLDDVQKAAGEDGRDPRLESLSYWNAESPLFVGNVLAEILERRGRGDRAVDAMHGKVVVVAEAAEKFGIFEPDGGKILSLRSFRYILQMSVPGMMDSKVKYLVPSNLYVPWWILRMYLGVVRFW